MPESYQKNVRTSSSNRVNLYSNQPTQEPPKPLPRHPLHSPVQHLLCHPSPPPSPPSPPRRTPPLPPNPPPVTPFYVPRPDCTQAAPRPPRHPLTPPHGQHPTPPNPPRPPPHQSRQRH